MAVNICEARSTRSGMNFCGVIGASNYPGNTSGTSNSNEYRCQLTQNHCSYNGGRYGVWIAARSEFQAKRQCEVEARKRGDSFCRISDVRANTQYNVRRYTCKIAIRSCASTRNSYVNATSFESARTQCNSVARRSGKRLCEVTRR
jgi:hypothetical protein